MTYIVRVQLSAMNTLYILCKGALKSLVMDLLLRMIDLLLKLMSEFLSDEHSKYNQIAPVLSMSTISLSHIGFKIPHQKVTGVIGFKQSNEHKPMHSFKANIV